MGNAVEEVGRAVDRVDDPAAAAGARDGARLLHEEAELGAGLVELLAENALGAPVGLADEVAGTLDRHLELLDLAEVAHQRPRRLARRPFHDVDQGTRPCHRILAPPPARPGAGPGAAPRGQSLARST